MKTRTAAFDVAWGNRRVRKAVYKITYKRRYWNGSAYVLEAVEKTVPRREIDNIGGISDKFDVPMQNRIQSGNVSLVLLDKGYKWLPSNTASGVWRKDATATVGYDPIGSEFTLSYGYILADETEEYLSEFVGVINDDLKFDSKSGTVTIQLVAKALAQLETADASEVGTTITDGTTSPANGNSVIATFSTQLKSLWRVFNVRVGGVARTQGTHYTLADLNDAEIAASIVFDATAIPGAVAILYDGNQWYRDKSISALVGFLCDEAGITAGNREISEPLFYGVAGSKTINSQADWEAGLVKTGISTIAIPGSISTKWTSIDDFTDGDYTANPTWTTQDITATVSGNKVSLSNASDSLFYTPHTKTYGSWEFKFAWKDYTAQQVYFLFIENEGISYSLKFDKLNSIAQLTHYTGTNLDGSSSFAFSGEAQHTYRITHSSVDNKFRVYVDGVLKDTTSGAHSIPSVGFRLHIVVKNGSASTDLEFTDLWYADTAESPAEVAVSQGAFESAIFDILSTPTAWGNLDITETLNGGTLAYSTASSTDGISFDAYVAIIGGVIQSALKRYFKVKVSFAALAVASSPVVDKLIANFATSELFVRSADFTGQTCLQAVQSLAILGGMEFGQKGNGVFFFRSKSVAGNADLTISQKNVVIGVTDYSTGYRDVRNNAQVRYGKSGTEGYYFSEYAAANALEASPTTAERFGEKVISLDLQRLIFSNDAQVADAVARKLYELFYRPRRKLKLKCRIIPHLDLSDKVSVSFHDSPLIEKAIFGDPLQRFPVTGPNAKTIARDILMKVVGHSPDLMKSESTLDLEEIL